MSFVVPVFLLNMVWLSYLEGQERFKELSVIRTMSSSLVALLPMAFLFIENIIANAVIGLCLARVISLLIISIYSLSELKGVGFVFFNRSKFKNLVAFGGWLTVSNIISPIMSYFDRFILSSVSGAGQVALYTAPAEIVSKMLTLPMAVSKALFPRMVVDTNREKLRRNSLKAVLLFAITIALPLFIGSELFLFLWLGDGYGEAALILKILLVGFVFNAMAQVPYASIQAQGFSKLTAKIHLFELMPYLTVLYYLINNYSIIGVAIAWSLRVGIDFTILLYFERKITI